MAKKGSGNRNAGHGMPSSGARMGKSGGKVITGGTMDGCMTGVNPTPPMGKAPKPVQVRDWK